MKAGNNQPSANACVQRALKLYVFRNARRQPFGAAIVRVFISVIIPGLLALSAGTVSGQELYVFSEPASNMPGNAFGLKYAGKFLENDHSGKVEQRQMLQAQFGVSKKWMVHASTTISDMYSYPVTRWESVNLYAKYRFLSRDDVHAHFRMAAFMEAAYSRNPMYYDELSLEGDQSGVQGGIILTQLIHKLALSATVSTIQVLDESRKSYGGSDSPYPYSGINYSVSAGYLLLPRKYNSYKQTNLNLYLELLGSQTLDKKRYFVDLAPALQLIFNSTTKLNLGHRFQLGGDMHRMAENSWLLSLETTFLNAFGKK